MTTSLLALSLALAAPAANHPVAKVVDPLEIDVRMDQPGSKISPSLYGIFFEEINQAGDGGIYGEMLRNRGLESVPAQENQEPAGWKTGWGVTLTKDGPNAAHPYALIIPSGSSITNLGFGGLAVEKGAKYRVTVWAKGTGTLSAGYGQSSVEIGKAGDGWRRLERTIRAEGSATNAGFVLSASHGGVEVAYASLMPERLWKGRKNGMRPDLAEKVDAMHPSFVRFPGGCYVEGGDRFTDAFDWKASVGPVDERKGLAHSMWGYSTTFGLGYHEYLQWCEDLGAAPLFVVNCGVNHRQEWPMNDMDHWVNYALDAIEYANGPVTSHWGALRAKNGHPKPFGLKYVEIGNENGGWFHGGNEAYEPRYRLIYDAIKKRYPDIVTIADWKVDAPMETVDEHYYETPDWFWNNATRYDDYSRKGPKVYVGEYAVTKGCGEGNLAAALGEAAFMTGLERNADVVAMASYAPLFVNVWNRQWNPNAIVFNEAQAYGTPSYHVQALFANNRPDRNVGIRYPQLMGTPPPPGGGIGLLTWNTSAEFKDVHLTSGDRILYSSDGIKADGLERARGEWAIGSDGTISQSALATDRSALLKGAMAPAGDYDLTLKARKRAGTEGFIFLLDQKDGGGLQWNVGGWGNKETAFQRNGAVTGKSIPVGIESGHWYDVRIERRGSTTRAYLDGKLVQELKEEGAPNLVAVAGVDGKAKELVVKVVNGSDDARSARLDIAGGKVGSRAKAIVLTGPGLLAENSFAQPNRIAPTSTTVDWNGTYTFAPRSVTVLRLPIR